LIQNAQPLKAYLEASLKKQVEIVVTTGAGGIGFELIAALRLLAYDQVMVILLSILACVLVVEELGARLRKALK